MKRARMVVMLVFVLSHMICQVQVRGAIDGSGTAKCIPKFIGPTAIGDSVIYEDGGKVGIRTTDLKGFYYKVMVKGNTKIEGTSDYASALYSYGALGIEGRATVAAGVVGYGPTSSTFPLTNPSDLPKTGIYGKQGDEGYAGYFEGRGYFSGYVGIGTQSPSKKLTVRGNILLEDLNGDAVMELGEGLDYAEGFDVSGQKKVNPGTVLIIDSANPGKLTISDKAYDRKVAGIVAGAKGQGSGVRLGVGQFDCDVALAGRVYCNVDATEVGIEPGDLLTTSARPGYAAKAVDYTRAQGAILGKAMEPLEKGKTGQILVLVTLQ